MYKEIKGYSNYIINESGDIINIKKNKPLKIFIDSSGYPSIELSKNGIGMKFLVHRLVALTFIENNDSTKTIVNHLDGNRRNCHVSNLEWTTISENNKHGRNRTRENLSKKKIMKLYKSDKWKSVEDFVIAIMKI